MNFLITGGQSGLGAAIVNAIESLDESSNVIVFQGDVRDPQEEEIPEDIDILINCAGINKIGYLENFDKQDYYDVMDTNAGGIFNMSKICLPKLAESKGTILNIVSNAAHMPMTSSAAYNASKAAALMLTKQMARELFPRHGITVFSVSPNKLKGTQMSHSIDQQVCETRGWTMEYAREYQINGLSVKKETPPELVAEFIAFLLCDKQRHFYLNGCDLQYGL
jgi:NAD(P)-dependent dehydrogenase (short-subunit alcohol dehydrogenase family)